ncbi:glycoside hydrolase family 97 protein [Acidobacteriota bacterium]
MNKNIKMISLWMAVVVLSGGLAHGKEYEIQSPNSKIKLKINISDRVTYSIFHNSKLLLSDSPLSLNIKGRGRLGFSPQLTGFEKMDVNETIYPVIREKSAAIDNRYHSGLLDFKSGFQLEFRVFDDGVAYRFVTDFDERILVLDEEAVFNFTGDHSVYFPTDTGFFTHQEKLFEYLPLSRISEDKMCYPPILVDIEGGPKVALTESDLFDYAGLSFKGTGGFSIEGIFPGVALEENQTRDRDVKVSKHADYIAQTDGKRSFPWRIMVIAEEDGDLITSQMAFKLARPLQLKDTSWIKPGKVAWDWWNALNVHGVDFRAGVNTETYLYYIDFASKFGIDYIILDEGWYVLGDLMDVNPEIDMEKIVSHAEERDVGIVLWVVWKALEDKLHEALDQFASWGIKGIKVDFMQRDDQWMVDYYWRIAEEAAKRQLVVDFHGAYKPTGLRRAYPNVLTREGVVGLEHNKWSENVTPEHDVTIPFIRMLAGPMDYTPGAMINAQKQNFKSIFNRPMSQGTRCHQLALYVVYESPLQMLSDSPSNYLKELECLEFLSEVPVVWDETRILDARVGDYVILARRSGTDWYIGALTDWEEREFHIDLSFLGEGMYEASIYEDGRNADRNGNDYRKLNKPVLRADRIGIKLAPGGGWVARFSRKNRKEPNL